MKFSIPLNKVDLTDIPAVAAAILKLLDSPDKHCQVRFAMDAEGRSIQDLHECENRTDLQSICLRTAFAMVTGDWKMYSPEVDKFANLVFGNSMGICANNNFRSFEEIQNALQKVANKAPEPA